MVHRRTVENWFSRGLPYVRFARIRFTTREAISRSARPGETAPQVPADEDAIRRSNEAREFMKSRFGF